MFKIIFVCFKKLGPKDLKSPPKKLYPETKLF